MPTPKKPPPAHSLASLFASRTILDILGVLLLQPDRDFYQRELADRVACRIVQAQRALRRIERAGLLSKTRRGNRVYYTANREHPAFEDLKRVMLKTVGLGDVLRHALEPTRRGITIAFVFGSLAAGSDTHGSDVDLLLISSLSARQIGTILSPMRRKLGRELNPVTFTAAEFREKAQRRNRFVQELLAGPKIWIVGSDDDLARIAGRRSPPRVEGLA